MNGAREALRGRWGLAIGVSAAYACLILMQKIPATWIGIAPAMILGIAGFVIVPPLYVSIHRFFLRLARRDVTLRFGDLFEGFQDFGAAWSTYFWTIVYMLPWILLFLAAAITVALMDGSAYFLLLPPAIIPLVIMGMRYILVFQIVADDPAIGGRNAVRRSRYLMRGNKGRAFLFCLRFFGYAFLGLLALGIGLLWAAAYSYTIFAEFYDTLRREKDGSLAGDT
jgi:uncharacterized membrane protein